MGKDILHQFEETDLVSFTIRIGADQQKLSGCYHIMNIVIDNKVNRIPTAKIVLQEGEVTKQNFELSNQKLLVPGNKLKIQVGYHQKEVTVFKGIIVKQGLKIRSGSSCLTVECKHEAVRLTIVRKSKYYYAMKDSVIFDKIFSRYDGIELKSEETPTEHDESVQFDVTDWDFILSRAQANAQICWFTNDGSVNIGSPDVKSDALGTLSYEKDILDFDAEIAAKYQQSKVKDYGWNSPNQDYIEVESEEEIPKLNRDLELPNLTKAQGRVKCKGAAVEPNTNLKLEGIGSRFNGKIFVSGVRHQISDGNWTTYIRFGFSPKWFTETNPINSLPSSDLTTAANGLQIGLVIQLENNLDKEDRIQIRLPGTNAEDREIWARIATLDAGENRGTFFLPEIDDEVVVGFINDDPNDAIVLGMLHSSTKPAPLKALDDNNERGIITRSQIKLLFCDDKRKVQLKTPNGKVISLDEDQILMEDEKGNAIKLDADGISLSTKRDINIKAAGNILMEGMNISQKANAQLKAEGSAGAELSSKGSTAVKGSIVQIN